MNGMGGLFELILGLSVLLACWFVGWRAKQLDKKKPEAAKKVEETKG